MCQQQDAVLRFPFALRQEVLHASVGPWVAALEGSQHWQYLLSSAPVPSYSMLGILSDIFWQFTLRKALHSMLTKSMKLQPSSSSSAKGHTGKHEEHARHHEDLLALWVAFNAEAMHQPHVLCPCSNLSTCCDPFSPKPFSSKNQASNGKKSPLLHLLLLVMHELSRWQQRYENELTSGSFQTLAFAMIWNCWKRAPLLKCSDTVCLSSIKTSKNAGTSKTCATCKSLRGLAFLDPRPRWNHRSSTCLSNTPALNIAKSHPIPCISATFSNIDVVYELTDRTYVLGHTLAITTLQTKVTTGRLLLKRIEDHKEQICCLSRCAWLFWEFRVFSMVQRVPTAGRCPTIPFCIVTRSLACFCRALGCCVRRLTTLAISAFICPCPKLQYAWDSFWHFLTIHPSQRTAQHAHQITEAGT